MAIQAYLHCKNCYSKGGGEILDVGMTDPETITIHCVTCNEDVGSFKLANPVSLWCDACNGPIGPDHKH
jgi:hypothetical protein